MMVASAHLRLDGVKSNFAFNCGSPNSNIVIEFEQKINQKKSLNMRQCNEHKKQKQKQKRKTAAYSKIDMFHVLQKLMTLMIIKEHQLISFKRYTYIRMCHVCRIRHYATKLQGKQHPILRNISLKDSPLLDILESQQ